MSKRVQLAALTLALVTAATLPAIAADNTLKDVMKKMGATSAGEDARGLAPLFDQTKAAAKADYPKWNEITDKGKAAAAKGDLAGAKATCKECHDAYRTDYKTKFGSKAP